jgi:hypothetical protein
MKTIPYCLVLTLIVLLGFPSQAEAYLDPTTGSIVLQVVIGGVLAVSTAVRLYWKRIRVLFHKQRLNTEE